MRRIGRLSAGCVFAFHLAAPVRATPAGVDAPEGVDPLLARVETADAHRFAELFARTKGHPDAAQLQSAYLARAGMGVKVFTPDRIVDAANLARAIAKDPAKYQHAIDVCLPAADRAGDDVRAVYLAYRGLFPDARLPRIFAVFGAGNSAGTAVPGAQVLGLEQACRGVTDPKAFLDSIRHLAAHETVHALQPELADDDPARHDLLVWALREGGADFFGALVTGGDPSGSGNAWAMPREAALFEQFLRDRDVARNHWPAGGDSDPAGAKAVTHWFWGGPGDDGRPADLGYWIGQRIVSSYYQRQPDKRAAIRTILEMRDPDAILRQSGYGMPSGAADVTSELPSSVRQP
ncbi:gliding motility protein GldB-related protein [Luteibacter jiangsuensis]